MSAGIVKYCESKPSGTNSAIRWPARPDAARGTGVIWSAALVWTTSPNNAGRIATIADAYFFRFTILLPDIPFSNT
jgi:hypothetical protein